MQLRSGRMVSELVVPDRFFTVLNQGYGRWPVVNQAYQLSTNTLKYEKFIDHIRWLMTYMTEKDKRTDTEIKANRLVAMAIAQSLINVSHNGFMRMKFRNLSKMVIQKFEEYDGPAIQEFDVDLFIADLKACV